MKSKVLQERLKRCGRIADHKECARKKGKSASAVSGTPCTNERTNERMSPKQRRASEPISHPSAMPTAPEPPSPTAMVSIFARQIWLFDSGGHTPQSHTSDQQPTDRLGDRERPPIFSPDRPRVPDFNSHGILTVVTSSQSGGISQAWDLENCKELWVSILRNAMSSL